MDKTVRTYASRKEMKADEYRYWQSRRVHERMDAVSKMTLEAYVMKGAAADVSRFKEPLSSFNAHGVKYLVV